MVEPYFNDDMPFNDLGYDPEWDPTISAYPQPYTEDEMIEILGLNTCPPPPKDLFIENYIS